MKKNTSTILLVVLLVVALAAAAYGLSNQNSATDNENLTPGVNDGVEDASNEEPILAPDFTLKDLDGNTIRLSDYKGKYVFLNFWASWCGPCKAEMPDMEKIHQKYGDELVIVAVNIGESADVAKGFAEDYGLSFQILLDEKKEVASLYGVSGIPTSYFLDKEGNFASGFVGTLSYEMMEEAIEDLKNK